MHPRKKSLSVKRPDATCTSCYQTCPPRRFQDGSSLCLPRTLPCSLECPATWLGDSLRPGHTLPVRIKVLLNFKWFRVGAVSLDRLPILIHQELAEIPLDEVSQRSLLFLLEEFEEWVCVVTVDVDLCKHVKLDSKLICDPLLDLRFRPRLLSPKLIAGEGQNAQALGLSILGVQRL